MLRQQKVFAYRIRGRSGLSLVEIMVSLFVILVTAEAGYLSVIQSLRYMDVNRDVRHAYIDLQAVLERIQATPPTQIFEVFQHNQLVNGTLIGGITLTGEQLTVTYLPGQVMNVVNAGNNTIRFTYGAGNGTYNVSAVSLELRDGNMLDSNIVATSTPVAGAGGAVNNAGPGQTFTVGFAAIPAAARSVWLSVTLQNVDGAGEVDVFVNNRGPYAPGPAFYVAGAWTGMIYLPDVTPLHVEVMNAWQTRGHAMGRTLNGIKLW